MNKQTLISNLNEDLAGELSAIIQYLTYGRYGARRKRAFRGNRAYFAGLAALEERNG